MEKERLWRPILYLSLVMGMLLATRPVLAARTVAGPIVPRAYLPLVLGPPPGPSVPAAWSTFLHDPQHTGRSLYAGPATPTLKWSLKVSSSQVSSPILGAGNVVYVGSAGVIYALVGDTGQAAWSYSVGSPAMMTPGLGLDGTIYFGGPDSSCPPTCKGYVYALSPQGSLKWSYASGRQEAYGPPTVGSDGTIYLGSGGTGQALSGYLYAFGPSGSLKWKYAAGGALWSAPALASDGTIYAQGILGMPALNPNGTLKWGVGYNTGDSSASVSSDGTIYFGAQSEIVALNPDGSQKWVYQTGTNAMIDSSAAQGADGTVYIGSNDGYLYAINPNGTLHWRASIGAGAFLPDNSSPAVGSDGTIYAASAGGQLFAFNPNGGIRWQYAIDGTTTSSPAIGTDGTIYVGSDTGYIYALDGPQG